MPLYAPACLCSVKPYMVKQIQIWEKEIGSIKCIEAKLDATSVRRAQLTRLSLATPRMLRLSLEGVGRFATETTNHSQRPPRAAEVVGLCRFCRPQPACLTASPSLNAGALAA